MWNKEITSIPLSLVYKGLSVFLFCFKYFYIQLNEKPVSKPWIQHTAHWNCNGYSKICIFLSKLSDCPFSMLCNQNGYCIQERGGCVLKVELKESSLHLQYQVWMHHYFCLTLHYGEHKTFPLALFSFLELDSLHSLKISTSSDSTCCHFIRTSWHQQI